MPFPVEQKWVLETEQRLGIRFPPSFVASMMQLNGGSVRTEWDTFELHPFMDKSDRKRIQRTCNSICRETAWHRNNEFFRQDLVVIAENGGGDLLVLQPSESDPTILEETIYWWDYETLGLEAVADDFSRLAKPH